MPNLALSDLQHLNTIDPTGRLLRMVRQLEGAVNNVGSQVNAAPVGTTVAPPQISAVSAVVLAAGIHQVTIQDNNPVTRGIHYIFEGSTTQDFQPGTVVVTPPSPSRTAIVPTGAGPVFWRAYSQYPTSEPSEPVYAAQAVDAGGGARVSPLSGTGSGTEPSLNPQAGAGFGFTSSRPSPIAREAQ